MLLASKAKALAASVPVPPATLAHAREPVGARNLATKPSEDPAATKVADATSVTMVVVPLKRPETTGLPDESSTT